MKLTTIEIFDIMFIIMDILMLLYIDEFWIKFFALIGLIGLIIAMTYRIESKEFYKMVYDNNFTNIKQSKDYQKWVIDNKFKENK